MSSPPPSAQGIFQHQVDQAGLSDQFLVDSYGAAVTKASKSARQLVEDIKLVSELPTATASEKIIKLKHYFMNLRVNKQMTIKSELNHLRINCLFSES